ncbi:MAG TPA: hypothetical protein VGL61_29450 [Kofleriaceae bacterium]|jgi:hypothetical protein
MRTVLFIAILGCSNARDTPPDASRAAASVDGGSTTGDAPPPPASDAGASRIIVINEVSAQSDPDWFEIVNATTSPLDTSQFIFVDKEADFDKAVPFTLGTIGPGALATVDCDGVTVPFKLGSGESLWVYRASDHALSDDVTWAVGESPDGGSYARIPDTFGPFMTSMHPTKGAPNEL